jgi:hypothetical protein
LEVKIIRWISLLSGVLAVCLTVPTMASGAVLYDQTDFSTSDNHGSNDWDAPNDAYDDQLADDFIVPEGQTWQISQVDVIGSGGYDAPTVNVFLYASAGALPGAELFHQPVVATNGPNYSIALTGAPSLQAGTYWISVQQAGSHGGTAWYWSERSVQSGSPAAYRNPGGASAASCTDWEVRQSCFSGVSTTPDELFKLSGISTATQPSGPPPTTATPAPAAKKKKCKKKKHKRSAESAKKKCKKKKEK